MMSAQPEAMAEAGIESNCAVSGCCTTIRPPSALTACRPSVPSDPMPDSTTATARSPWALASDENNTLIGMRRPRGSEGLSRCNWPLLSDSSVLGGITYTQLGSIVLPFSASRTGICVTRCSSSASMAFWVGSRCCTTRKAAPLFNGTCLKNSSRATRPPADAPMPMMRMASLAGLAVCTEAAEIMKSGHVCSKSQFPVVCAYRKPANNKCVAPQQVRLP